MVRLKNEISLCSNQMDPLSNGCKCECDDCSDDPDRKRPPAGSKFNDFMLYPSHKLPKNNELMTCPNCQSSIVTKKKYNAVILTHLVAILLIPVLSCWIPYVFHCLQVVRHRCPICDVQLGVSSIF